MTELVQSKQLSLQSWKIIIPELLYEELHYLGGYFIKQLDAGETYYSEYIKALLFYDQNDDRLTDVIETLLLKANVKTFTSIWYQQLWIEFFQANTSSILIDNFFIYLDQIQQHQPFTADSQFIQKLHAISNPYCKFKLLTFQLQYGLETYENTEILQHFYEASTDSKLAFIPTLTNLAPSKRNELVKTILSLPPNSLDLYILLAILFQMKNDLKEIFDSYESFEQLIKNMKDKKILELLFTEYTKPESVTIDWIRKLLFEYLKQNTTEANMIIASSGEYLAEWDESLKEEFLQFIMGSYNNLKESLARIISPLWIDEQIIFQLAENENRTVQSSLFESVIPIYQQLSQKMQGKLLQLLKSKVENKKYYGLLLGYNFEVQTFAEEIATELPRFIEAQKEELHGGMLLGLGMRWNELPNSMQAAIKELTKKLSKSLKKELLHGLDLVYGTLNLDGMNLAIDLQSYDYQISPDEIKFD